MNVEKNVPEIRFEGFSGDWDEKEMLNCSSKIGDGLHGTPTYTDNTGVYFINGNNLVSGSIVITNDTKQVNKSEQSKDDFSLDLNTILLSINGTIGNLAWYQGQSVMLGKSVAYITLENCDNRYMYTYLQTERVKSYFLNNITGSTIKNLGLKVIRESKVLLPAEKKEQIKIGNTFQKLDNLINQHQQKHDKLSNIKKAMSEKMFPKQDETIPEIRFQGFSGDWEVKKLGHVYNFNYGEFNINPSNGGQYPVYGANGIIGGYTRFNAENSAVIGHMGEYAGCVLWAEGRHFVTYNGTIAKPKKSNFNTLFGYFKLAKMNLKKICGGSGQPFLSYDALERLDFVFPSEKEQTQIGNYFQKLDALINQHQQQITKLNNIKQACLNKMFV